MTIIIDASAAIEIALQLELSDLFQEYINKADLVIAPNFHPVEITNVFWKYSKFGKLEKEKCIYGIDYCIDLIDDFVETKYMCREAFAESFNLQHPAYDMFYLILARRENGVLLTKDKKMTKIAEEMKIILPRNG